MEPWECHKQCNTLILQSAQYLLNHQVEEVQKRKQRICHHLDQLGLLFSAPVQDFALGAWNERLRAWVRVLKEKVEQLELDAASRIGQVEQLKMKVEEVSRVSRKLSTAFSDELVLEKEQVWP